jgi:hypothetical protein
VLGIAVKGALRSARAKAAGGKKKSRRAAKAVRVLLYGAFGNGNLGDAYQALAMRHIVMRATGLPAEAIFATSLLGDEFPYPVAQRLPSQSILDADLVNGFDVLLIGGGGLLAHPHEPLLDNVWVGTIHTPIILYGVGTADDLVGTHPEILKKAWFVSGRDQNSLFALQRVRTDSILVLDPIASMDEVLPLAVTDNPETSSGVREGCPVVSAPTVWVLKHPISLEDEDLMQTFAAYLSTAPSGENHLVAIEPALDKVLERWFPGQIEYITSATRLAQCMKDAERVVSMRYHGAIFAGLTGKPSYGCSQEKIRALYAEAGLAGAYFTDPAALLLSLNSAQKTLPGVVQAGIGRQYFDNAVRQMRLALDVTAVALLE